VRIIDSLKRNSNTLINDPHIKPRKE